MALPVPYAWSDADAERLIRRLGLAAAPVPLVPEVQAWVASELTPIWEATEAGAGRTLPPPYWAFVWPGSQALARYLLDRPAVAAGQRVLDFAAGGGVAGIAAARAGAHEVLTCDLDPLASAATRLNAALNGVAVRTTTADLVGQPLPGLQVVLVGDVCYERTLAARIMAWLRRLSADGAVVLLADPGRAYAPSDGLELLATYSVPTLLELESAEHLKTRVVRVLP